MSNNKVYWKGFEELENDAEFLKNKEKEFVHDLPMDEFLADEKTATSNTNRRDFLKFLGFSVTAATLAACETPIKKAIPYVIKPETVTPGVANYFASAYYDGSDFYGVLVKTREGRPIKIDGNKLCHVTKGATNARTQASVLSLYDNKRAKSPMKDGAPITWEAADTEINQKLTDIATKGGKIVILSNTVVSPSTNSVIKDFTTKFTNVQHIQYDAVSYSAIREANQASFGKSVIPGYHFDKALAVVSFGADFLNGWLMSGVYEKQYVVNRKPEAGVMSRHFQFEAIMSLAGSNADYRTMVKPSELGVGLIALYNYIAAKSGKPTVSGSKVDFEKEIAAAGDYLLANKGKALVVCGLNDVNAQLITNSINDMLGAYGNTINLHHSVNLYQGQDKEVMGLMKGLADKTVKAVILYGTNPAYTLPNGEEFNKALANAELSVSFGDRLEETKVQYLCPDHNYLESWNDYSPVAGHYVIQQPTIHPLFDTRSAQESLLVWAGFANRSNKTGNGYREYIKAYWKTNLFAGSGYLTFDEFWNTTLHDGCFASGGHPVVTEVHPNVDQSSHGGETTTETVVETTTVVSGNLGDAAAKMVEMQKASKSWEVVLYEKVGMGTGTQFANPILQELPDPITRVVWDNYITMSPEDMDKPEFKFNKMMGEMQWASFATVSVNKASVDLPVVAVPGQKPGTIGIALGYGKVFGKNLAVFGNNSDDTIGKNAYPFMSTSGNYLINVALNANVVKTEKQPKFKLASTQTHHTMMGRDIIKETSLKEYKINPRSGNPKKTMHTNVKDLAPHGHTDIDKIDYWKDFKMINHRWGLSIDLNSCTGCGACVVACHVENNVPVVGKREVHVSRDMHWLRIDRYYTSDADDTFRYESGIYNIKQAKDMETPGKNPRVAYQPIMCQHCNHAPCETVCPVLATTHSTEGLNQMTYNRCVGTRYCANNCPYKVRRFNWFKYNENEKFDFYMNDDLGKMVLNPDVTVRARGVMEKCSMCVQRIQSGKLEAKKESRMVNDGEIQTACSDACPTNAIIFGDYNDAKSKIHEMENSNERSYKLLEEIGIKPNVIYQTKVRNVEEEYKHFEEAVHEGGEDHGGEHQEEKHESGSEEHGGH
jgi:molybdopterin-containing oxidoreductase family iron-sulfur binding subunit